MRSKQVRERLIKTLEWMITDMKWRHDITGIEGNYSPELKEAMNLLEELKKSTCDIIIYD